MRLRQQFQCMMSNNGYINFWRIEQQKIEEAPKFTDMELALMEGGNSLEEKVEQFQFLKQLKNTLP